MKLYISNYNKIDTVSGKGAKLFWNNFCVINFYSRKNILVREALTHIYHGTPLNILPLTIDFETKTRPFDICVKQSRSLVKFQIRRRGALRFPSSISP